jgi:hypothetical protein
MTVGLYSEAELTRFRAAGDVLFPELFSGDRQLPSTVLWRFVTGRYKRHDPESESFYRAMFVGALHVQFFTALAGDFKDLPMRGAPVIHRRSRSDSEARQSIKIDSHRLRMNLHGDERLWIIPVHLHKWLNELPQRLIRQLVEWAPPVVFHDLKRTGLYQVAGNWLSGFIACHRDLGSINVRQSTGPHSMLLSGLDLGVVSWALIEPVVARNEEIVIARAADLDEAMMISGKSRSHCASIRAAE